MAKITLHPRFEQATSARRCRIESRIEADRDRAIQLMKKVRAQLSEFVIQHEKPELSAVVAELGDLVCALENVDLTKTDSGVVEMLSLIVRRLLGGRDVIGSVTIGSLA